MSAGYHYLGGAPPLPSTTDGSRTAGDIGHSMMTGTSTSPIAAAT